MNQISITKICLYIALTVCIGCEKPAATFNPDKDRQEMEEWRKERLARLMGDDGWLTLVGLFWLKEGENSIGSDSSNDIILPPGKASRVAGSIVLRKGALQLKARSSSGITHNNSAVRSLVLQSDREGRPTILCLGTVSFYVIKRGDQYAVRVMDTESLTRRNFQGLKYFSIDPKFRIEARFEPHVPPKLLEIVTQVGTVERYSCPGALAFAMDGKTFRLDAVIEKGSEDQLFIMLADETNGKETYAVGRQLYTALPDSNNRVILDFNKAYNWPCVFTDFATCPIPPPQNRLPIRVEAGEKMYRGHQ